MTTAQTTGSPPALVAFAEARDGQTLCITLRCFPDVKVSYSRWPRATHVSAWLSLRVPSIRRLPKLSEPRTTSVVADRIFDDRIYDGVYVRRLSTQLRHHCRRFLSPFPCRRQDVRQASCRMYLLGSHCAIDSRHQPCGPQSRSRPKCARCYSYSSERDPEEEAAQRCCSRRCVTVTVSDVNGATWRTIPQTST